MAKRQILLKDRRLVIQRLAEGQSTRQAIQGTSIASNQTAARIAKQESHVIKQRREDYIKNIESRTLSTDTDMRVYMLGQMMMAKKLVKVPININTSRYRQVSREEAFVEVEDWNTRLKAIQYMDHIEGINNMHGIQVNVMQQQNTQL
jgi:hypothetical protein